MNRSALPERLTDFVGQEHLLEAIPQHLRFAAGLRLVVLRGLGSGATAVAVEYLRRTYPRHYAAAEWIGSSDSDETGRLVSRALNRFREVGGRLFSCWTESPPRNGCPDCFPLMVPTSSSPLRRMPRHGQARAC